MLYVTTRNNTEVYTANRALRENRGPDGGMYLPFRMPGISWEELEQMGRMSCNQVMAEVLNRMFRTRITGWDVDFCIGRFPVRQVSLGQRIVIGECWHNPEGNYDRLVKGLQYLLRDEASEQTGDWPRIAVRIAVLFALFADLIRDGQLAKGQTVDVSVVSGEFSAPMSAWYARQWGLPIGNIVCCCNENNDIWNLMCHGQMRTDSVQIASSTPLADISLPTDLERLIFSCGGSAEVQRYLDACRSGTVYKVDNTMLSKLRSGLYVSVVSSQRIQATIPSAAATHHYLLSPYSALAYAGLLDYRAKTGAARLGLVLAERSPECDLDTVAKAMGMTEEEIREYRE